MKGDNRRQEEIRDGWKGVLDDVKRNGLLGSRLSNLKNLPFLIKDLEYFGRAVTRHGYPSYVIKT